MKTYNCVNERKRFFEHVKEGHPGLFGQSYAREGTNKGRTTRSHLQYKMREFPNMLVALGISDDNKRMRLAVDNKEGNKRLFTSKDHVIAIKDRNVTIKQWFQLVNSLYTRLRRINKGA